MNNKAESAFNHYPDANPSMFGSGYSVRPYVHILEGVDMIWPSPYTSTVGHLSIMVDISLCTVTSGSLLPLLPNC